MLPITEIQEFVCSFWVKCAVDARWAWCWFSLRESHSTRMKPKCHLYLTWARFTWIRLSLFSVALYSNVLWSHKSIGMWAWKILWVFFVLPPTLIDYSRKIEGIVISWDSLPAVCHSGGKKSSKITSHLWLLKPFALCYFYGLHVKLEGRCESGEVPPTLGCQQRTQQHRNALLYPTAAWAPKMAVQSEMIWTVSLKATSISCAVNKAAYSLHGKSPTCPTVRLSELPEILLLFYYTPFLYYH